MKTKRQLFFQYTLPHRLVTNICGFLARVRVPLLKNRFIQLYKKIYHVDMSEALEQSNDAYDCLESFFIRKLKPESRPIDDNPKVIISPADGAISEMGKINENLIIQAKKHDYSLEALLANDHGAAKLLNNGEFATIYLAPKDYHRVHMPLDGMLEKMIYVPGKLFSVSPLTAENIPNLFARNERVISIFNTEVGKVAIILVGAMIVGSVTTSWSGRVMPSRFNTPQTTNYSQENIWIRKGEEMGYFSFGSTVIMLFPQNALEWSSDLKAGSVVRMGQAMAQR
ncbi:MAG: archaetidylserine decarboxylase [Gammaproteobacteria bacterium]